jgi:hypothetical protein
MTRRGRVRARFWAEAVLAGLVGFLALLTLVWHDWLESVGVDPDHHNGSAEWLIVVVLALLCVVLSVAARAEWRRAQLA